MKLLETNAIKVELSGREVSLLNYIIDHVKQLDVSPENDFVERLDYDCMLSLQEELKQSILMANLVQQPFC